MISAISWVPKGVAKSLPAKAEELTQEEIEELKKDGPSNEEIEEAIKSGAFDRE